jgi:hypothetical protein
MLGEIRGEVRFKEEQVDAVMEIKQLTAIEPGDLKSVPLPKAIESGQQVLI